MTQESNVVTDQVVQSMSRDGKRIKIDGDWYGAYDPAQAGLTSVKYGDTVSFTYTVKDTGTAVYRNIKGKVTVSGVGSSTSSSGPYDGAVPSGAAPARATAPTHYDFPVGPRDRQRSIIRQNSVTNAVNLTAVILGTKDAPSNTDPSEIVGLAHHVIDIAKVFEAYSTGDLDVAEAKAAVEEAMGAKENVLGNVE